MENNTNKIRINKYLAGLGIASRRKIDQLINDRKIILNGKILTQLGTLIDPEVDLLVVNGHPVSKKSTQKTYIMLNKPVGVLSSSSDDRHRKTVIDLVKSESRLFPVGRLDYNSGGLIILTNDGDFSLLLTHPRYHLPKTYEVDVRGKVDDKKLDSFRHGIELEDGKTLPSDIEVIASKKESTVLRVTLYQGKKRQIRRMCAALHLHVLSLVRVAIGDLHLGSLRPGAYRNLSESEISLLKDKNCRK